MAAFTLAGFRVLGAVAEHRSITAAARALGYTQSAVSRQVATLERTAGAALFTRSRHGVELTEAGRRLLPHARRALDAAEAAAAELSGPAAGGRLRVGGFSTAMAVLVPRAVRDFAGAHPNVRVTLSEGGTAAQLRRVATGAVDVAVVGWIGPTRPPAPDVTTTPLLDDPLLIAVGHGHALARQRSVEVTELVAERWIVGSRNRGDALLGIWPSLPEEPRIAFVVADWAAKLGMVAEGLGITVVPSIAAASVRPDVVLIRVAAGAPISRAVAVAASTRDGAAEHGVAFEAALHRAAGDVRGQLAVRLRP